MTAKPWGECRVCRGLGEMVDGFKAHSSTGQPVMVECPCIEARRAAFEEAMEAVSNAKSGKCIHCGTQRAIDLAAIRAKMEGE